ncbi:MAG: hypothetical protein ACRCWG_17855 [Sarcina sp.]
MKVENLVLDKKSFIDMSKIIDLTEVKKSEIVNYLKSRDEKEFLILKSYDLVKQEKAAYEINKLREKVDFMISRIRKGEKEAKIKSLEERFSKQKDGILNKVEGGLVAYKKEVENLNQKIKEIDRQKVYLGYPFVETESFENILFAFPVELISKNNNLYIKNIIGKEILSNSKVLSHEKCNLDKFNIKHSLEQFTREKKIREKIAILNLEVKENQEIDIILANKATLTPRITSMLDKKGYISNKNIIEKVDYINTSDKDTLMVTTKKEDYIIIGKRNREKLYNILLMSLVAQEKVLIVSSDLEGTKNNINDLNKYLKCNSITIETQDDISTLRGKLKVKEIEIEKYKKIQNIMKIKGTTNLTVEEMYQIVKGYDAYNDEEYFRYKKSLNIENITYDKLVKSAYSITTTDIEKYKNYKALKDRFITFNEYPHSYEELIEIKKSIEEILEVSQKHCKENKNYYKKITFKMKRKSSLLTVEEVKEIGRECAREKNRELLIEDKNSWSIKNIFNASKQKEKRKEELELYKSRENNEINTVVQIYSDIKKYYDILEKLDENLFNDIISILCKDNFKEEISKKIISIEFSLTNKDTLKIINSWDFLKAALVEYLYKCKNIKASIEKIILFRISDELLKISKEYELNIARECKEIEKLKIDELIEQRQVLIDTVLRKVICKNKENKNFELIRLADVESEIELKSEIFDTIILDNCKFEKDIDIVPIMYRGKRGIVFRDEITENEFEKTFLFIK